MCGNEALCWSGSEIFFYWFFFVQWSGKRRKIHVDSLNTQRAHLFDSSSVPPQAGGVSNSSSDQQPDPQPPLPPPERPPPPHPSHVWLLPPVCHFCLHTCLTGCLTPAANQVAPAQMSLMMSLLSCPVIKHYAKALKLEKCNPDANKRLWTS